MSELPVSVCIITKNEEKHIGECLKRIKPYGFEIVVADTGSTDQTRKIAVQYADKVLDFAWINDFSAARNFCASHASNDWIFALDSDEYIDSIDIELLKICMKQRPDEAGSLRRKNLLAGTDGSRGYSTDEMLRFYNRKKYEYVYSIHEQLMEKADKKLAENSYLLPIAVIHHGYLLTKEENLRKQERNVQLLLARLIENPDDSYVNYQLGQSYYILEEYEKALKYYRQGLACAGDISEGYVYVEDMIISMSKAYTLLGKTKEAVAVMETYAPIFKTAKYIYAQGLAYEQDRQPLKALLLYIKTTAMNDVDSIGSSAAYCYERIITIARQIGEEETAKLFIGKYQHYMEETRKVMGE